MLKHLSEESKKAPWRRRYLSKLFKDELEFAKQTEWTEHVLVRAHSSKDRC